MSSPYIKRLPRILLALSLIALPLLTLIQAENRHLIPEEDRPELSSFYSYLRARYGQPVEQGPETVSLPAPPVRKQSREKNRPERPEPKPARAADAELLAMTDTIELPEPPGSKGFAVPAPSFYRGLYINNAFVRRKGFEDFLKQARRLGMNVLVIDIQPRLPPQEALELARSMGFYLVGRIVVFEGGLKTYPAPRKHVERVLNRAEEGARLGFAEIQLDYIRFADNLRIKGLTLKKRYRHISSILAQFEKRLRPYRVRIGADLFGRIAFNRNDIIGQQLELFDRHTDVIYPMLYPSHFYGDRRRRRKPYETVLDGMQNSQKRVKNARIVSYIQAFKMRVHESGLSLEDYIRAQIDAAQDAGGAGYVAWNARNDYRAFFRAVKSGRLMPVRKTKP